MLPGLDTLPSATDQENDDSAGTAGSTDIIVTTEENNTLTANTTESSNENDANGQTSTVPLSSSQKEEASKPPAPVTHTMSAQDLAKIKEMQKQRGLKRSNSKYIGSIGNKQEYENAEESMITNLTPKKGNAKIDARITKIRYLLDQYKQNKPEIELEHKFDFNRAFWEFIYNYFYCLAWPILLYREGRAGFMSREMLSPLSLGSWLLFVVSNVTWFRSPNETKSCFWFPVFVMNVTVISQKLVLATKYGYYPSTCFIEYNDRDQPASNDYIASLLLIPGWLMQHPLTMARELYYTEERLGVDLSRLRLTFRDTKAFDLGKGQNCTCSRYWTKLDWFVPYIYVFENSSGNRTMGGFFAWILFFIVLSYYTTAARIAPWSNSNVSVSDCNNYCWILIGTLPLVLGVALWASFLWTTGMAFDFTRRYNRMKLCTHLLDPKRETFNSDVMRRSYKAQLFGSVAKLKPKKLKPLDLQTIDFYSADTVFAWSQFRTCLYDIGHLFLLREEAYNGYLVIVALTVLFFFLYSMVTDGIVVVWEDLIITMLLAVFVLVPSMWTLSCGNSLNYQTLKQQKILSERAVEMLHFQYVAEQKGLDYWVQEVGKARDMIDATIDVLSQDEYSVTFLGIRVDNSVFQLITTIVGILLYISGYVVYTQWIVGNG